MKHLLTGLALLSVTTAIAQDSIAKKWTITGSLDAYYRYNFHNAKDSSRTNNYTSFTNSQNSFELGMASVKVDHSVGKVSETIDLGFGTRAEEFSYNDDGLKAAIKQAYISYAPSKQVKLTAGKWATHVGYELLDAYLNRNYSMDYMFSYGPFFHMGLKADFTFNNIGFMAGVANPTDLTTASFSKKFLIGQISIVSASSKIKCYLNYVGGKDETKASNNQFDLVVSSTISDKLSVGYNGSIKAVKPVDGNGKSWWGSALYLTYDPLSNFGLAARGEYFSDAEGVGGFDTNIFDATLSANIRIDNLTIIPEFRIDASKSPIFFKNSDALLPTAKRTGTCILAVTYHFSND